MKRSLIIFFLCSFAYATTSVTGKIQNLGTGNVTSGAFARFWLRGCSGNQPRVNGTSVIGPSQGAVFFFDIPADSAGNVTGTLYSTRDATGLLGGDIECGGSKTSVWYGMQIFSAGKGGPEVAVHAKNSATLDITQVTPITTNPVIASPTGDSTYARLDGGNQPFTGNITPSGTGILTMGNSTNRWKLFGSTLDVSGAATLGSLSVAGTSTFSGLGSFLGGLSVTGASAFNGAFTVTGNAQFTIDGGGNAVIGGALTVPSATATTITGTTSGGGALNLNGAAESGATGGAINISGGNCTGICGGQFGGAIVLTPGAATGGAGDVVINKGIAPDAGSGFKHKRGTTGCATGASAGAVCTTTVTWTTTFPDANYTAQCNGRLVTSGVPLNGGITAQIAASVTFQTVAATASAAQFTNIDCIAVHD